MSNRQRIKALEESCTNWSELCIQLSREIKTLNNRVWELEQSELRSQAYFWVTVAVIVVNLFIGWLKRV